MNTEANGTLDTLVQEKIEGDADFQSTLVDLSDEDKETALIEKRNEVSQTVFEETRTYGANQKKRAEKAEKGGDKPPKKEKEQEGTQNSFSLKDLRALDTADVHEDDLEAVEDYAKYKKISIAEALKDPIMKTTLDQKEEFRKTANAANTKSSRPSANKVTGEQLSKDLSEGKVPEKGSDAAEDLFWTRRGGRPNK